MTEGSVSGQEVSRARFVAGGLAAGGTALAAGSLLGASASDAQATRDVEALQLLLVVEQTEAAFYRAALDRGGLSGELRTYAAQVARQEQEHLAFVRGALGAQARPAPRFEFAASTLGSGFAVAAAQLEDWAVAGYNGQATNVSRDTLESASKIVSVEARHAAWIRSIGGMPPAPDATDQPRTADQVLDGLERLGLKR
jgi:hypothetical protein